MSYHISHYAGSARRSGTIDFKHLPSGATFLRIMGVNYVHLKTADEGDLYVTEYGVPFLEHLQPEKWYEEPWFSQKRERLQGTSAVYRVPTMPVQQHRVASLDLVVKWSRVGQDVPLDTFTLNKAINAEFNTPFEEFSLVEELRRGHYGPVEKHILMQKPMAIFAPSERMQLWQTGRSRDKIMGKVARHPGIEIDILRSYILLYAWIKGLNVVEAGANMPWDHQRQTQEREVMMQKCNEDLETKGFMVADNKPTHIIVRMRNGEMRRDRLGNVLYGMVDYELLARTPKHEEAVKQRQRSRYLHLQKYRFAPQHHIHMPEDLKSTEVLGVDYVFGRSESTGGSVWVVGKDPELFGYFLPEKWRYRQVQLSQRRQTYYVQSKDRIHLVWEVSRLGELAMDNEQTHPRYEEIVRYGFNSPFEEFAHALELGRRGVRTTYPRAIYMTGREVQLPNVVMDENRMEKFRHTKAPDGSPLIRLDRDYILIWGYWRGLEDGQAPEDAGYWTPIDATRAAAKGIISAGELPEIMQRQREILARAGFEDMTLCGDHILLSYIPEGALKRSDDGFYEMRQCNFEMVKPLG